MNRTLLFAVLFFTSGLIFAVQSQPAASGFLESLPAAAEPESAPAAAYVQEDDLYSSATNALNDGQYDQAVAGFDKVAKIRARKVDAALYWKAYALHKLARNTESLGTIEELRKVYPRSRWRHDAEALRLEIRGSADPQADPNAEADDEMKILALNSIMQADPERGVAGAQKLLQGNSSLKIKERTLFVLAQSKSTKAQEILLSVAKGATQPELQARAIKYLAISGGNRNQALRDIYASSTNAEVKKQVLRSFIINGDKEAVLNIVHQEKDLDLRREAIRQLGVMGMKADLLQIYKENSDPETKETVLHAMGIAGDVPSLIEIAKTETDRDRQSRAIKTLGIFGGAASLEALTSIYSSSNDIEIKRQIIRSLFIHSAAKEMVAMARKETNPELKKELVRNLSIMHSPEVNEYMMEILNK